MIKDCFRKINPDIRVVGIVDPNEKYARSWLESCDQADVVFYKDLKEMMHKGRLDALAIGTRCNLHAPYAIEASKYEIPLYLEKPVAINMEQVVALEHAFEKSKCSVVVSFPLRVSSLCLLAREYLDRGVIGSNEHILSVNYVPYGTVYFDSAYRNYEVTQGLFLQKATHDFDYMMFLMGSNVTKVAAMGTLNHVFGGSKKQGLMCSQCSEWEQCLESPANRKRNCSGGREVDHYCVYGADCGSVDKGINEDSSSVLLEFASGAHGVYTQVFFSRRDAASRGSTISGYHGTLSFDWYKNEMKFIRHHKPFSDVIKADANSSHFGGDMELAHDFIGLLRGKSDIRATIWAGLQSAYTCLAAKQSMQSGKFVSVRQVGQI
jgi:predicted dehydrogenase